MVIVPTFELKEALETFRFCTQATIEAIPTTVYHEFFPLFKKIERSGSVSATYLPKAKILIKGLVIPKNVQEFIEQSYKDFDITISSVGELSDSIMNLLERRKIINLVHWADPSSNKRNFSTTYALERDLGFDIMVYCFPDDITGDVYNITNGDEDVLFAISNGTLPICGIDGIGFDKNHLFNVSGLVFSSSTPFEEVKKIVRSNYYDFQKFNTAITNCRRHLENRVSTSPFIMGSYFKVLFGKEKTDLRNKLIKEKNAQTEENKSPESVDKV